jgi:hypothetical protein
MYATAELTTEREAGANKTSLELSKANRSRPGVKL